MAITLYDNSLSTTTLEEFIEYVDNKYDELTVENLVEIAPHFAALGRNRRFMEDFLVAELQQISLFQEHSPYSAQSVHLGGIPAKFYIRANVWLPCRELHPINRSGEADLYSYDFAHDHNFDFLTVGYFGPGYETDIYEYDHEEISGEVGESVEVRFLESTTLPVGKLMIYRASKDIHVQKFPSDFSISLNLLTPGRLPMRDQFSFDLERGTVSSVIRSSLTSQQLLFGAARALNDPKITDLIKEISVGHSNARIRHAAANVSSNANE